MKSLPSTSGLLDALLLLNNHVNGLKVRVTGQKKTGRYRNRRADNSAGVVGLQAINDISYFTNITVGDQVIQALVDTGSSDFVVAGFIRDSNDLETNTTVTLSQGKIEGLIKTALITYAGFTITNQTYLEIPPDETIPEGQGVIGFGPKTGSRIWQELSLSHTAAPVMDSIFLQDTSIPNIMTVNLGRSADPFNAVEGDITIGEVLDGLTDIQKQPQIPITHVAVDDTRSQHFQVLIDQNGFIGPDGNFIPMITEVEQTEDKTQVTAIIDTGSPFTQVPSYVAQAIYSGFDGAELINVPGMGSVWSLACTIEVNVTINLGGQSYPIHPLDATCDPSLSGTNVTNSAGDSVCLGTFQPSEPDKEEPISFDVIIGASSLRSMYTLINYGSFTDGGADTEPYLQFLSTVDLQKAHAEFATVRLGGDDSSGDNEAHTRFEYKKRNDNRVEARSTSDQRDEKKSKHIALYIIAGIVGGTAILAAIGAFFLARARKDRQSKIVLASVKYEANGYLAGMGDAASNPPVYNSTYDGADVKAYEHPYESNPYPYTHSNTQYSAFVNHSL